MLPHHRLLIGRTGYGSSNQQHALLVGREIPTRSGDHQTPGGRRGATQRRVASHHPVHLRQQRKTWFDQRPGALAGDIPAIIGRQIVLHQQFRLDDGRCAWQVDEIRPAVAPLRQIQYLSVHLHAIAAQQQCCAPTAGIVPDADHCLSRAHRQTRQRHVLQRAGRGNPDESRIRLPHPTIADDDHNRSIVR